MARVLLLATLCCCVCVAVAVARGKRDGTAECHYKYTTKTYRQPVREPLAAEECEPPVQS